VVRAVVPPAPATTPTVATATATVIATGIVRATTTTTTVAASGIVATTAAASEDQYVIRRRARPGGRACRPLGHRVRRYRASDGEGEEGQQGGPMEGDDHR